MGNLEEKIREKLYSITVDNAEKFQEFHSLLLEYNGKYNLTAITEEKEVLYKHFLDSAMGEHLFSYGASVAEVGSGAGFPSIPLAILRSDLKFTLIESVGKKCDFLKVAKERLQLNNVTVKKMRAEDAGRDSAMRERFDISCARAVARLNTLAEYLMPLIKKGGKMIAYKGKADEELSEAKRALSLLGGGTITSHSYDLPEEMGSRSVIVVEKTKETPQKYPRGQGRERSAPIV